MFDVLIFIDIVCVSDREIKCLFFLLTNCEWVPVAQFNIFRFVVSGVDFILLSSYRIYFEGAESEVSLMSESRSFPFFINPLCGLTLTSGTGTHPPVTSTMNRGVGDL